MDGSLILSNLLTPPVLFFALGVAAALLRSDLEIPQAVTRGLSLYLLFSIGLHGGAQIAEAGLSLQALKPLIAGVAASALFPLGTFLFLRARMGAADAAAIAATYGSISAVTFITACSYLDDLSVPWSGSMVAAMALMESPAILVAVLLARRAGIPGSGDGNGGAHGARGGLLGEAFLNGPVFLLLGSVVVGALGGRKGWEAVEPFVHHPFKGVLCLFLLDLGILAARRLDALRASGAFLAGFSLGVPLLHAALAIAASRLLGLEPGDALLFTVLCASASYIAVPAAVRLAIPQANPGLYLPMSLALTFPFNVVLGIPLYMGVIETLWSAP